MSNRQGLIGEAAEPDVMAREKRCILNEKSFWGTCISLKMAAVAIIDYFKMLIGVKKLPEKVNKMCIFLLKKVHFSTKRFIKSKCCG